MAGTVVLDDDGDYVVNQMWTAVSDAMEYSCNMMEKLFDTLGVPHDEKSLFCQKFSSPVALRDAFISYLPRTFKYGTASGNGNVETSEESVNEEGENGTDGDDADGIPAPGSKAAMLDRIGRFASEMAKDDNTDEVADEEEEVEMMDSPTSTTNTTAASSASSASSAAPATDDNSQEMMAHFRAIVGVDNVDNILEKSLAAIACLERKDNIQGDASQVRQAKSLVQRWLTKPLDTASASAKDGSSFVIGDKLIERGVVVLVNIKVGIGSSASTVLLPFRVVDIYDKYYNKWFMSKSRSPIKNWKKEPKKFKLKIRMLSKDIVNEYCDVGLVGNTDYSKGNICGIIEDSQIVNVVGKLQSIA